jgi:hypothetical protein
MLTDLLKVSISQIWRMSAPAQEFVGFKEVEVEIPHGSADAHDYTNVRDHRSCSATCPTTLTITISSLVVTRSWEASGLLSWAAESVQSVLSTTMRSVLYYLSLCLKLVKCVMPEMRSEPSSGSDSASLPHPIWRR